MKKLSNDKIKQLDIYDIIKNKDEYRLKKLVITILNGVVEGVENKDEVSYFESDLITIPMELGWEGPYIVKDRVLDEALTVIANFEGDSEEEAKKKARLLLRKLKTNNENK